MVPFECVIYFVKKLGLDLKIDVFSGVTVYSLEDLYRRFGENAILKMEASGSCETLVTIYQTRCHTPEGRNMSVSWLWEPRISHACGDSRTVFLNVLRYDTVSDPESQGTSERENFI
jgi:hypothetical protein